MPFKATQAHVDQFHRDGFTVLEQIIPVSLLGELRRSCDTAREIARQKQGPNTQRLQPIEKFAVNFQPF
ncbi:MAG TPA: hypothetical protein VEJ63_24140, partial [Planctomycetota bacterium]|nr:hypothetical protein [Planctomycetota bacterium]